MCHFIKCLLRVVFPVSAGYSMNVNVIPAVMTIKEVKKEIKDYVYDHYKYYGFYPYDVEVGNVVYTYEQYMDILSMTV